MKPFLRLIFVVGMAALIVAIANVPSDAARRVAAGYAFDGQWSVVIYTLSGDCPRALRYSLRIWRDHVVSEDSSYQAYGGVGHSGAIRVTVVQGQQSASGAGRLAGNSGRGWWRTSTGQCSGQWTAERRLREY